MRRRATVRFWEFASAALALPVRSGAAQFAGIETRTVTVGRASSSQPTVLLLHGYTDSADTWRPVLGALASTGVHAVALDMPQFGSSARSDRRDLTALHKEFLAEAIAHHDAGAGVVLVGNSLGGWDSLHAVLDHPQRVRAVVAVSPAGFPTWGMVGLLGRVPQLVALTTVAATVMELSPGLSASLVTLFYAIGGSNGRMPADLREYFRSHMRPGDLASWLESAPEVVGEVTDPTSLDLDRLERPVRLMWGSRDWLLTTSGARRAQRRNPEYIRLQILPGAAHCAQTQHPDLVADAIVDAVEEAVNDSDGSASGR